MSLFPDDKIVNKNIHPLTKVDMSKSIPKKCAKTFGTSVESIFEGALVKYQYNRLKDYDGNMLVISKPSVDWSPYDFLVDNRLLKIAEPKIFKVQVKSTSNDKSITIAKSTGSRFSKSWERYFHHYTEHEVDIFACYINNKDEWWLIPQKLVGENTSIKFTHTKFAGCKNNFEVFYV